RQYAFGGFHVRGVEPEAFGQLEPALDAALATGVSIMILDTVAPFHPDLAVAEARDHHCILQRNGGLIVVAVQRPGLHLAFVELAAVQEPMERMQAVIAGGADLAQRRLEFGSAVERYTLADRERRHPCRWHHIHSTISVPSAPICQPAPSAILRSAESFSSAG